MRYGTRTMPCTASTCGMTGAEDEAGEGGGCSLDKAAGGQTRSSERGPTAPARASWSLKRHQALTGTCSSALASAFFMELPSRGMRSIFPVWANSKWVPGGRGITAGGTEGPW